MQKYRSYLVNPWYKNHPSMPGCALGGPWAKQDPSSIVSWSSGTEPPAQLTKSGERDPFLVSWALLGRPPKNKIIHISKYCVTLEDLRIYKKSEQQLPLKEKTDSMRPGDTQMGDRKHSAALVIFRFIPKISSNYTVRFLHITIHWGVGEKV